MLDNQALIQFLHQALGVNYLPRLQPQNPIYEKEPQAVLHPKLIFLNYDENDQMLNPQKQDVFDKITKAMGLANDEVWWVQGHNQSFADVLNRLRVAKIEVPVVVMKKEPEVFEQLQQTGAYEWAECFSISEMIKNPNLKKITWRILQYFLKKG